VDVLARAERLDQRLFSSHMGEHAQLDLRVIGGNQDMARGGDEGAPDLAAQVGADRDVLQVWIGAAQPSGCRHCLVEAGVNAPRLGVDHQRQRVDVRALQFVQRPPVEHQPRHLVGQRQFFEDFGGSRKRAGLAGLLRRRQVELLEEDSAELLRRVDVERFAGELVDARRLRCQFLLDVA
jgi:hypothetical protein